MHSILLFGFKSVPHLRSAAESLSTVAQVCFSEDLEQTLEKSFVSIRRSRTGFREAFWPISDGISEPAEWEEFLLAIESGEHDFFRQLDRVHYRPLSISERSAYHAELTSKWLAFLKKSRPKLVVFANSPHFPWHTTAFHAANALGVKSYVLSSTILDGISRLHLGIANHHGTAVKLPGELDFAASPSDVVAEVRKGSDRLELSNRINSNYLDVNSSKALRWAFKVGANMFLPKGQSGRPYSPMSRFERVGASFHHAWRISRLEFEARACSSEIPWAKPYVYLPLQYQPEQSTDPEAGVYSNPLIALKFVLASIPEEFTVVVKEHPRQLINFPPDLRTFGYRYRGFYRDLLQSDRVVLADPRSSASELISQAQVVVTATGSSAYSALLHGTPAITLADTWLSGCLYSPCTQNPTDFAGHLHAFSGVDETQVIEAALSFFGTPNPELIRISTNSVQATGSLVGSAQITDNTTSLLRWLIGRG